MSIIDSTQAAVTVSVPSTLSGETASRADTYLDLSMKVHDAVRALIPYLLEQFEREGKDVSVLENRSVRWQLVKGHRTVLDPSLTLELAGVKAGDKLRLVPSLAKETYNALIDDVPESIAEFQIARYRAWSEQASRVAVAAAVPTIALGVCITATQFAATRDLSLAHRLGIGGVAFALALMALTVAFTICRKEKGSSDKEIDERSASAAGSVTAASGLLLLIPGAVAAVPVGLSYWHVLAACIACFTGAVLLRSTTRGLEIVTYAAMVCSGVVGVGCGIGMLLPEHSVSQVACLTAGVGIIYLLFASSVALRAANIPAPFVPTLGESHIDPNETADITMLPTSSSTQAIRAIINRERQIVDAHNAIVGMSAGGILSVWLPLLAAAATMDIDQPVLVFVFMIIVIACMFFRAVSYEDMLTQATWLVGMILIAVSLPIVMAFNHSHDMFLLIACAALLVAALVAAGTITRTTKVTSPLTKHFFEIVEFICYVAVFVLLALILNTYGMIRHA